MPYRLYINCPVYVSQVQDVKNCRLWHPYECPRAAFIYCLICFNMAWTARPSDTCPSMMQHLSHSTAIVMPPPLQRAFSFLCCHCFKLERWVTLILPFLIIFVVQHLPPSNFCSFYFYTFLLFSLIFSPLAHSSFALDHVSRLSFCYANQGTLRTSLHASVEWILIYQGFSFSRLHDQLSLPHNRLGFYGNWRQSPGLLHLLDSQATVRLTAAWVLDRFGVIMWWESWWFLKAFNTSNIPRLMK